MNGFEQIILQAGISTIIIYSLIIIYTVILIRLTNGFINILTGNNINNQKKINDNTNDINKNNFNKIDTHSGFFIIISIIGCMLIIIIRYYIN